MWVAACWQKVDSHLLILTLFTFTLSHLQFHVFSILSTLHSVEKGPKEVGKIEKYSLKMKKYSLSWNHLYFSKLRPFFLTFFHTVLAPSFFSFSILRFLNFIFPVHIRYSTRLHPLLRATNTTLFNNTSSRSFFIFLIHFNLVTFGNSLFAQYRTPGWWSQFPARIPAQIPAHNSDP